MSKLTRRSLWPLVVAPFAAFLPFSKREAKARSKMERATAGEFDDLDRLIGMISRMVEEAGFHWWTIYPAESEGQKLICVSVVMGLRGLTGQCTRGQILVCPQYSVSLIQREIEQLRKECEDVVRKKGTCHVECPRDTAEKRSWGGLATAFHDFPFGF